MTQDGRFKIMYIDDVEFYHKIGSLSKSRIDKNKDKYSPFFIQQMTKNHVYFLRKQRSIFYNLLIIYLLGYFVLRFFVSSNYTKNLATFNLLLSSYIKGFKLKL